MKTHILCLGDSNTHGYCADPNDCADHGIRFNEEDARPMGRSGHGVRAIRLAEGDEVVGVCICREGGTVLTVTENGKGRRSDIDTYRITARGGKGIRNYDAAKDKVAAVKIVDDVDDVLLPLPHGKSNG